jgi:glycosyltransferase involved in cell wall biosynthesis
MNRLSIITVVKNDLLSLQLTFNSIRALPFSYEWIVIDGGSDQETLLWMRQLEAQHTYYLREIDKNLYDAMNKGIQIASGTHAVFINAGDEINNSPELLKVISDIPKESGFIGSIKRNSGKFPESYLVIKPSHFLKWTLQNGIRPANHQATIYPSKFVKYHPYDIELGLFADQVSILELLETHPVIISRKIVVSTFQNGGLGDNQYRGAFLWQMQRFNFQFGNKLEKFILLLRLPVILVVKVTSSLIIRVRILLSR